MIQFKNKIVLLILVGTLCASSAFCDDGHNHSHGNEDKKKKQELETLFTKTLDNNVDLSKDVILRFETKCQSCHDGFIKNKLAPPIIAVQQVYLRLLDENIDKAQSRMIDFLLKPKKQKALMKPAVELYRTMPNLGLSEKEAKEFSKLILRTKFTIPDWFNEHFKSHKLKK